MLALGIRGSLSKAAPRTVKQRNHIPFRKDAYSGQAPSTRTDSSLCDSYKKSAGLFTPSYDKSSGIVHSFKNRTPSSDHSPSHPTNSAQYFLGSSFRIYFLRDIANGIYWPHGKNALLGHKSSSRPCGRGTWYGKLGLGVRYALADSIVSGFSGLLRPIPGLYSALAGILQEAQGCNQAQKAVFNVNTSELHSFSFKSQIIPQSCYLYNLI